MAAQDPISVVVFDLNKTFYTKSSKEEFYKFICKKRPKRLRFFFEMAYFKLLSNFNLIRQTEFKENFFNYLDELPPEKVDQLAREFWQQEYPHNFNPEIKKRLEKARAEGQHLYCATGALEIYVKPLFDLFQVNGFAGTQTDYTGQTYKVKGEACKGKEKTRRLEDHYQGRQLKITEAYSDNEEDIFQQTEKPYLVKKGKLVPFEK